MSNLVRGLNAEQRAVAARVKMVGLQLQEALRGDWRAQQWIKQEALTTSDFPAIFQILNNGIITKSWSELPPGTWTKIAKRKVLNNLRKAKSRTFRPDTSMLNGQESAGEVVIPGALPRVGELQPYRLIGFQTTSADIGVTKSGIRIGFSWEAFKEDDYDNITSLPTHCIEMAKTTEDVRTWGQVIAGGNWNTAVFGTTSAAAGFYQRLPNNPALSRESLLAALQRAQSFDAGASTGADGEVSNVRRSTVKKWALVVPPALEQLALSLITAVNIKVSVTDTDDVTTTMETPNPLAGKFEVVVEPYIPVLAGSTIGDTMWGIFPLGGNGHETDTIYTTFLRGEETPQIRITNDQGTLLGGGALSGWEGSFDRDEIQIRLRYFVDAAVNDVNGIVVSRGTGQAANA